MKKIISVFLLIVLLAACSPSAPASQETKSEAPDQGYADGNYFAMRDEFDPETGWKETVALKVEGGKITDVKWNAVSNQLGIDKLTAVKEGKYPMVAAGNAQAEWDEQAEKAEAYLIETQDPKAITYKDDAGHTDAISGVTVSVEGLFELAAQALAEGPATPGPFQDGVYHQEADDYSDTGWKDFVDFVVMNGHIVTAKWNAINKDDPNLDKLTAVKEGDYPMVAGGASAEWDEQAQHVENYLLEHQELDGPDAISSVSIHYNQFFELIKKALGQ